MSSHVHAFYLDASELFQRRLRSVYPGELLSAVPIPFFGAGDQVVVEQTGPKHGAYFKLA